MAKPYSEYLRERAVRLVEGGASRRECASVYEVAPSTVIRWMQRFDATGEISAAPMGGARNTRITGSDEAWLLALVAAEPDLTIAELRERLRRGRGLVAGYGAVWRFLDRHGLRVKKNAARQRAGQG